MSRQNMTINKNMNNVWKQQEEQEQEEDLQPQMKQAQDTTP